MSDLLSKPKIVNLQDIADEHLKRLMAYRDGAEYSHAAIAMMTQEQLLSYQKILPPRLQDAHPLDIVQIKRQALLSLGANTIRDIMTLDGILFEEIRLCIEVARLMHSKPSEEELKIESAKIIERRPSTLNDGVTVLDQILVGGFPWIQEFRSLEKLYYICAAQASGQPGYQASEPVRLSFCVPKFPEGRTVPGAVPFEITTSERDFPTAREVPIDPRMNYEIFFTAYAVYRGLIEGCKKTVLEKYQTQPE
jgi:hypothetical protein